MLKIENQILRLIASGASLEETTDRLCRHIENELPGVVCTIFGVDPAGLLHPLAAPSLPETLRSAIDGVSIGPDIGSCGAAAYTRAPVSVVDIARDERWASFRDVTLSAGLKACWSSPIFGNNGQPVGALALYFREPRGPNQSEEGVVASGVELCELALRRHERVLDRERRASVDALTELPNRAAFNTAVASLPCDEPGSWALFVIDLDNLKTVNDTFGHQAGDGLIRAAGERISKVMAPDPTFRVGGDEFAVVVRDPEPLADLAAAAARILTALETPAVCGGHTVVPAATIGGAVLASTDPDAATVYKNADFALYHAKESGRGGFVRYWPGIGTRITLRQDAIRDVLAALDGDRIDAHYQPIVRLDTHQIVGVEALCRMTAATGEIIFAGAFQEATSDANVAAALTGRMLSIVAQDVRRWLDDGIPLTLVSVNISPADFYSGDLMRKLEGTFGAAGVSLSHLIFDVNEDASLKRRDKVVGREIKVLRQGGIRVALDDFGKGQASLTHLLSVPVDLIKIDPSFVARLWRHDPGMAVVEGLIDLARKLDIRVIAEGIESEVQASELSMMGCELGQGFAFSRAVDRWAIADLLRRHADGLEGAEPLYPGTIPSLQSALGHGPREVVSADGDRRRVANEGPRR